MTRMSVITPSFAPDFEMCADLHRSVLEYLPSSVHHHIIVPRSDLKLFVQLAGPSTHIHCEADLLPPSFVRVPFSKLTVNLGQPFPPVRGWICNNWSSWPRSLQVKMTWCCSSNSDIEFIRPFGVETFVRNGVVRFYRSPMRLSGCRAT